MESEIPSPARRAKRHSDIISLSDIDDDIVPELFVKADMSQSTHSQEPRHRRPRPRENVDEPEDEQMSPTKSAFTIP